MRVLVVEDERMLADAIAEGLRAEAMAVDVCYDGNSARTRLAVYDYDVAVLDRDLPGMGGDELCRRVAEGGRTTRVLMLTAATGVADRVHGLSIGADDYLGKPFAFAELTARVRALARRSAPAAPPVLERAGISLDSVRRQVFRDGRYVPLSNKEFGVLAELMRADGAVVSAERLLEKVWDEHIDPATNVVRVTMMTLRRKLADPPVIETLAGVGYVIR
ncbi:response regulator transcription factor [Phytomonospora endophytica]|uniref:DNA-binding response OmpR family regulator n=1 Tax=Phytomonospora endophytica TaxID=714109 RepID=A0A841FMP7_9ACTN|nr:response regulator transcription factor [Phytomonospora endophytica]MBB6037124.1 DNA-binding response OmpR family regulator [Phytomonospora endophytica]GIG71163.1 transcriptional regulatory protein CutR [Phytomonospora endophytica]